MNFVFLFFLKKRKDENDDLLYNLIDYFKTFLNNHLTPYDMVYI